MDLRGILTTVCQLSCVYCHQEGWPSEGSVEYYPKLASADDFFLCCTVIMRKVSYDAALSGGELLPHRDLSSIVASLVFQRAFIGIITNGKLLGSRISDISKAAAAHHPPISCNGCSIWSDLYIGVNCSTFICPWGNLRREEVGYCE